MKDTELRLGNLISYRGEKIAIVSNIGNTFETVNDYNGLANGSDDVNEYEPIPLTEEWIIKFGFKDHISEHRIYKPYYKEGYICPFNIDRIEFNGKYCYEEYPIHWVHQLQNLYFALTGEELTIKP